MAGIEGSNPSAGPSVEIFIDSKMWLHKFNLSKEEHCTALVIMKTPKELDDEIFDPIDKEIYTVVRKALEVKYCSAARPAYMAALESDPQNVYIIAEDAGITALAEEDTPKEIASEVQTAVISKVREVLPAPEDIVKTVWTIVTLKLQLPNEEWKTHSAHISKENSTSQSVKLPDSFVEMIKAGKILELLEQEELPEKRLKSSSLEQTELLERRQESPSLEQTELPENRLESPSLEPTELPERRPESPSLEQTELPQRHLESPSLEETELPERHPESPSLEPIELLERRLESPSSEETELPERHPKSPSLEPTELPERRLELPSSEETELLEGHPELPSLEQMELPDECPESPSLEQTPETSSLPHQDEKKSENAFCSVA